MNEPIFKYKEDVTRVFGLCIDVLNVSRSLQSISFDLKLLAINGIVQASKLGNMQGQSLITLSGFLSTLPLQIAPELNDLAEISKQLATQITITTIEVRKFILYSNSLLRMLYSLNTSDSKEFLANINNLIHKKALENISFNSIINNASDTQKSNIIFLSKSIIQIMFKLNDLLLNAVYIINNSKIKIDKIRRNGLIANYMGSNISIESAYLTTDHKNFEDLVSNIKEIVRVMNQRLDEIMNKTEEGQKLLSLLIKSRIIK